MKAWNVTLQMPAFGEVKILALWATNQYNLAFAPSLILIPQPVPSLTSSIVPSGNPTTSSPSLNPSITPSQAPQVTFTPSKPTNSPTFNPTTTPSIIPSSSPVTPSISPSVEPSIKLTVKPTAIPSLIPSSQPTIGPTSIPSVTPTNVVPKTLVTVSQQLGGVDPTSLQTTDGQNAFKQAVVDSLSDTNIYVSDVKIIVITLVGPSKYMRRSLTTSAVKVDYTINAPTTVASTVTSKIQAAVSSSTFQTNLQAAAIAKSVIGLQSATATVVPTVVVNSPTSAPIVPTPAPSPPTMPEASRIAAITISCIGGFLLLVAVSYLSYKTGQLTNKEKELNSQLAEGSTKPREDTLVPDDISIKS